jgi:hypothetical protein
MRRVTLALFVVAVVAGLAGGLFYTWVLDPVEYYDTAPGSLSIEDKMVYLAVVGDLYAYNQDLEAAKARLAKLNVKANGQAVADLIEQYLDGGGQPEEVRNLARLAEDLGASGGILLVFGGVSTKSPALPPTTTAQPAASPTLLLTVTPAPTFRLIEQTAVCAEPGRPGKIKIWVRDGEGNELAGAEVVISWATGEDRFFTGLRPEEGAGYTDFEMSPQIEYEVALVDFRGDVAQGLSADLSAGTCPTGTQALDWRLTFQQAP